jgi:sec-independent protein translocase protein TatA
MNIDAREAALERRIKRSGWESVPRSAGSDSDTFGYNMSIGPLEIGILLIVVLLVFGAKRLPELGSSLGGGIRGFGKGIKGEDDELAALEQPVVEAQKSPGVSTDSSS